VPIDTDADLLPSGPSADRSERALAPVASVLLLAITVVLAGGVVTAAIDTPAEPRRRPSCRCQRLTTGSRLRTAAEMRSTQPSWKFECASTANHSPGSRRFRSFRRQGSTPVRRARSNAATDGDWRVGGSASFRVAGTNDPTLEPGRTVTVDVSVDGDRPARRWRLSSSRDSGGGRCVRAPRRYSSETRATVVIARGLCGLARWM